MPCHKPQCPVYCVFIFNNKISPPSGDVITENDADTHKSLTIPTCQNGVKGRLSLTTNNKQGCPIIITYSSVSSPGSAVQLYDGPA